jgi:flagellar hook-basal body complex protein FliE
MRFPFFEKVAVVRFYDRFGGFIAGDFDWGYLVMAERILNLSKLALEPRQSVSERGGATLSAAPFVELLEKQLREANEEQLLSEKDMRRLATGDVNDISDVVLSVTQGELALRMVVEIRNKLVEAYQTLSRMPV